jgi:hypothetical protein
MAGHDVAEPGHRVEGVLPGDLLVGGLLRELVGQVGEQVVGLGPGVGVGVVADRLLEELLALGDLATGQALLAEFSVPLGELEPGLRTAIVGSLNRFVKGTTLASPPLKIATFRSMGSPVGGA